jgi:predicted Rossmann fold nucleotide-binding protein DprA/Smf involved in DNA uptake
LTQRKLRDILPENAREYYEKLGISLLVEAGYTLDSASRIVDKKTPKLVEHVEDTLKKHDIHVVHREDEIFPASLRELSDCPTILYVR